MIRKIAKNIFRGTAAQRRYSWVKNKIKGPEILDEPHMPELQRQRFEELLAGKNHYLEYGAGGSTVLAAQHVCNVVSIESDPAYAKELNALFCQQAEGTKVFYASIGPIGEWGKPINLASTNKNKEKWENYATLPWNNIYTNGVRPDFILIDGRFRVNCVLTSLQNLKKDSDTIFFMDDYLGRDYYKVIEPFVEPLEIVERAFIFKKSQNFDPESCATVQAAHICDWR